MGFFFYNTISNYNIKKPWLFNLESDNLESVLNPLYITGISDAEGSFQITIQDIKGLGKTGYKPFLEFKITQRDYSVGILYEIKKFFDCGRINIDNSKTSTMKFVVTNNNDLMNKVIPHFDKYQLKSSKYLNYLDFKKAIVLMNDKKHYNLEGINTLREIKSNMNKSRLYINKFDYCWNKDIIVEPEWLQGFIDGEGSFQCEIYFSNKTKRYPQINFSLQIQQNNHDIAVLNAIKEYMQCGYLKPKYDIRSLEAGLNASRKITALWIRNLEVLCPFFDLYPLYTIKRLDYLDWKRLIELKKVNAHLTKEGLELMKKIKNSMNNKRFK
jgi:hypothetical protein